MKEGAVWSGEKSKMISPLFDKIDRLSSVPFSTSRWYCGPMAISIRRGTSLLMASTGLRRPRKRQIDGLPGSASKA